MANQPFAQSCCTTPSAMCFWMAAFVLLYGTSLLIAAAWPVLRLYDDALLFAALGAACILNFGQNRTLHCGITGPLFLFGAVAAALIEAGIWTFDLSVVWGVVLIGLGIAFVIEWRTVGRNSCTA